MASNTAKRHADAKPAAASSPCLTAANGSRLRVRMYRQGLGDCFLLSVLRPQGRPFHMMIDCGVILGTPDAAGRLRAVVADIVATTAATPGGPGHVDVLVVSHQHFDHVAGFKLAKNLFALPTENQPAGKLSVGEVWFAWTEDPANTVATKLRSDRQDHLKALTAVSGQLAAIGADTAPALDRALQFFGVSPCGTGLGDTAEAMAFAATLSQRPVRYHLPGTDLALDGAPELHVYVLGPPTDRADLMRTDSATEVYHLDADDLLSSVRLAAGGEDGLNGRYGSGPFDQTWSYPLSDPATGQPTGPLAEYLEASYFGPQVVTPTTDLSWRRVDGAWLASSEQLALALDSATNNTSLALAIEVAGSGKVLLFPADAQVGNWLSWQPLQWTVDGKAVTAADLLGRTVFYKVGHHGSHNATLKAKGLELMPTADLVAFIPVDHAMAVKKGWGQMPLPSLVQALQSRCGPQLVCLDEDLAAGVQGVSSGGAAGAFGSLFYEWTLPLAQPEEAA